MLFKVKIRGVGMNDFVQGFQKLGLSTATPADYKNPESFAGKFQKPSLLKSDNVNYSSGTLMVNREQSHSISPIQNQHYA